MLAWTLVQREHLSAQRLWNRMAEVFPAVYARVTGGPPIKWATVCRNTELKQGSPITPRKLMQRADKAERYCEWTPEKGAVVSAYETLVASASAVHITDMKIQNRAAHEA
jgi:hypothetical protein